jgi:hypothetical protein
MVLGRIGWRWNGIARPTTTVVTRIIIIATVVIKVGRWWRRRMPRWLSIAIRRRRHVMRMAVSMMWRTCSRARRSSMSARRSMSMSMNMRRPHRMLGR